MHRLPALHVQGGAARRRWVYAQGEARAAAQEVADAEAELQRQRAENMTMARPPSSGGRRPSGTGSVAAAGAGSGASFSGVGNLLQQAGAGLDCGQLPDGSSLQDVGAKDSPVSAASMGGGGRAGSIAGHASSLPPVLEGDDVQGSTAAAGGSRQAAPSTAAQAATAQERMTDNQALLSGYHQQLGLSPRSQARSSIAAGSAEAPGTSASPGRSSMLQEQQAQLQLQLAGDKSLRSNTAGSSRAAAAVLGKLTGSLSEQLTAAISSTREGSFSPRPPSVPLASVPSPRGRSPSPQGAAASSNTAAAGAGSGCRSPRSPRQLPHTFGATGCGLGAEGAARWSAKASSVLSHGLSVHLEALAGSSQRGDRGASASTSSAVDANCRAAVVVPRLRLPAQPPVELPPGSYASPRAASAAPTARLLESVRQRSSVCAAYFNTPRRAGALPPAMVLATGSMVPGSGHHSQRYAMRSSAVAPSALLRLPASSARGPRAQAGAQHHSGSGASPACAPRPQQQASTAGAVPRVMSGVGAELMSMHSQDKRRWR